MSHKKNREYFSEPNCREVVPSFESKTSKTLRTSSTGKDSEPKGCKWFSEQNEKAQEVLSSQQGKFDNGKKQREKKQVQLVIIVYDDSFGEHKLFLRKCTALQKKDQHLLGWFYNRCLSNWAGVEFQFNQVSFTFEMEWAQ